MSVGNLEARRDFSDVRDIVRGYRLLGLSSGGTFNLGSGRARSIREVLETLIRISGIDVKIEQDPTRMRGPEVPELYGSYEAIKQDVYRYWYDLVGEGH
jgi:GDP-4-dehydro-6-deoxy-D-mannose reductase